MLQYCRIRPREISLFLPNLGHKANDLQIEPDQSHHQSESGIPFHIFGRTGLCSGFNKVEIENKVERRDQDNEEADADSHRTAVVNKRHVHVPEEREANVDKVYD